MRLVASPTLHSAQQQFLRRLQQQQPLINHYSSTLSMTSTVGLSNTTLPTPPPILPSSHNKQHRRSYSTTSLTLHAMKPGTPLTGLAILAKQRDAAPPTVLPRSEYPSWVNDLAKPLIPLAKLRQMEVEDATEWERNRFLKLSRRLQIKETNADMGSE